MNRKRKLKLKKEVKTIFSFIVVAIILVIFFKSINNTENASINVSKIDYPVVDYSEEDVSNIKEYFADGMYAEKFNEILNYNGKSIESANKYSEIKYDFNNIMHYDDIVKILYQLNNSESVTLNKIGTSLDSRDIFGVEIGSGNKVIFLDANVHAAEVANTAILTRFMIELVNAYESGDTDVKNALNSFKLAIVPCVNPDGYEVYNFGVESLKNKNLWVYKNKDKIAFSGIKSNANGVDINRNFPTQNAGLYYNGKKLLNNVSLKKKVSNTSYFGGESLGSEPETKALMYFMLKHYKNVVSYINLHSQGRVIYAGKPNLSKEFNDISNKFASKVSSINRYTVYGLSSEEVGEGNDGSATDFMAEIAHEFPFSTKTLRLSSDKYLDNNVQLKYKYPVITLETIKTYTRDPEIFKTEYYDKGMRDVLFSLLDL